MITVIGSLNMDLVTKTDKVPKVGETFLGADFKQAAGGKGANQADAIAKLGGKVAMIGRVGNDQFGHTLMKSLECDGVEVSCIQITEGTSTGIATIIVNGDGDNSIIVVPGANFKLTPEDVDDAEVVIKNSDIMIAQLEVPIDTIKYAFKKAKEYGKYTILNPAPARELDEDLLKMTDLLVPNETELEILTGRTLVTKEDMLAASKELMQKGVKEMMVTLGSNGCLHIDKTSSTHYPAHLVEAVDTTAAGDSFIGAIATAFSEGKSIEEAINFASKVSALTVTRAGAQDSLPTKKEVEEYMTKI
ncbi:MAG: rbsK [Clostridia bacterium]|jgi:ribokinase|nr:rbsK [Clostridia bacterium]